MTCGLFSSFDPSTWSEEFELKWMSAGFMVVGMGVLWQVFTLKVGLEMVKEKMVKVIWDVVLQSSVRPGELMLMVWSVFSFIVISNLGGLVPFSFTLSSHLCVNLSLSAPLWGMGVLAYMYSSLDKFSSHFLPTGSPAALWPFLVMVELVSWLIRPGTLGIRLMANMMAGHLITSLLGGMIDSTGIGVTMLPIYSGLLGYEIGVSLIQAYVFASLIILYSGESE